MDFVHFHLNFLYVPSTAVYQMKLRVIFYFSCIFKMPGKQCQFQQLTDFPQQIKQNIKRIYKSLRLIGITIGLMQGRTWKMQHSMSKRSLRVQDSQSDCRTSAQVLQQLDR